MCLNDEQNIDKSRRMNKYLKDLMSEGYIISSGIYFLPGGLIQYELLHDEIKLEILSQGSNWIIDHEHRVVTIYTE